MSSSPNRSAPAIQADVAAVEKLLMDAYRSAVEERTQQRVWLIFALMVSEYILMRVEM
jgi:hypothetical protein